MPWVRGSHAHLSRWSEEGTGHMTSDASQNTDIYGIAKRGWETNPIRRAPNGAQRMALA